MAGPAGRWQALGPGRAIAAYSMPSRGEKILTQAGCCSPPVAVQNGLSALTMATRRGKQKVVQALLAHGAVDPGLEKVTRPL